MSATIEQLKKEWATTAAKDAWRANAIQATHITPQAIRWAWPGWLALGKLTILAGAGGTGKTTLSIGLAAVLTSGGRWPDGEICKERRSVIIWSSEDDPADTIVPRLIAAGADLSKVYILQGRINGLGDTQPFDPSKDIDLLAAELDRIGDVGMIMIDPIVSAVAGDMHRANDVRRALQGLVDLAEQYDCAVLGITHFSKGSAGNNPAERVLGSQAFGALARTVLVAAKQEDSDLRVLARAKSNIAVDDGGCSYSIDECSIDGGITTTRVLWGDKIEGCARDILADVERVDNEETNEKKDAEQFLISLLADGQVSVKQVKADAAGAGHAWRTVERAKKSIGVEAVKAGLKEGWVWRLGSEDRQLTPKTATKNSGGLREKVAVFGDGVAAFDSAKNFGGEV
ncbi:AAA family ATPase [uncultured Pseudomonas sp.]|mgnify:CR=1 FL=1|uniref:AAA family ATPase n=1 Tax=uncultured Pseudomonas sp. TaxID=114707 RepID=UPI0030D8B25D|tara:strand:- start:1871 stop:3070 length:1200 start_codon:yes stop_codon:yes gene_type:complete